MKNDLYGKYSRATVIMHNKIIIIKTSNFRAEEIFEYFWLIF